jgi:hypothetical protein
MPAPLLSRNVPRPLSAETPAPAMTKIFIRIPDQLLGETIRPCDLVSGDFARRRCGRRSTHLLTISHRQMSNHSLTRPA